MSDWDTSSTIPFKHKPRNIVHTQAPQYRSHTSPAISFTHKPHNIFTHKPHNIVHTQAPQHRSHTSPTISFTYKPHNIPPLSSSVWFLTNPISRTPHHVITVTANIISSIFKWFIPVVCDSNINIKRYQEGTSKHNNLLWCRVSKGDYTFRPFTVRPSSGLTWWKTTEEQLQCYIKSRYIVC
jgi:hypothetical protein